MKKLTYQNLTAHDNELQARETCSAAHELATDVEIIAKTTHQLEDELARTTQIIAVIETELLATGSRQFKTEKIVGELQAKCARVENEVKKTKQLYEKRNDKLAKMGDFLEKNRQLIKAGNKGLGQVIKSECKKFDLYHGISLMKQMNVWKRNSRTQSRKPTCTTSNMTR